MEEQEKIVNYSKDTFLKSGFYKITMDEIAKGLHISKKTIYKYFPSKNKLVDSAIKLFQNSVKHEITNSVNKQENSILKIRAVAKVFAELSIKLNEQMLYDLQVHRPDLWQTVDKFRGEIIKNIWEEIIDQGKNEGVIIDKPNDIIVSIIYYSIRGIISPKFLLNHNYSINEAFQIAFEIIIKGILTEKGLQIYNKLEQDTKNEKD